MSRFSEVVKPLLCACLLTVFQSTAGCATFKPTPYQPVDGGRYGYSDEWVAPGEYRITVKGNDATSAQVLWNQLLYRAAEIALEKDHEYFVMVPNGAGRLANIEPAYLMPQFGVGPSPASAGAPIAVNGRLVRAAFVRTPLLQYQGLPVGVEPSRQLIATGTMRLGGRGNEFGTNVFDARATREGLAPTIVLPSPN
jgi:hypothetical protein